MTAAKEAAAVKAPKNQIRQEEKQVIQKTDLERNLKYPQTAIESALTLLNQISVRGIDNCKRICMIEQILQEPITEGINDGDCSKEEPKDAG